MMHRILRRAAVASALALSFRAAEAAAQPPSTDTRPFSQREVVLDGIFHEWEGAFSVATQRRRGHGPHRPHDSNFALPYPRLDGVQVRHDADAVYLLLRLDREVSLQSLPGTLVLLMDADGEPASGWTERAMPGVDAVLEFSPVWPDGARMGAALRTGADPVRLGSAYDAGLMAAPTHASDLFELRIRRGGAVPFGARMTARLVSLDSAGAAVDSLRTFSVDLTNSALRPAPRGADEADPLARPELADFRTVSWNVGRETLFERPDEFGAILRALAPDLLILDEVGGGHSAQEVEALLDRVVPGDQPWGAVYGVSGGSQRGVIATRGAAPLPAAAFDRPIPYPDSTRALVSADPSRAAWLRRRLTSHVPATGAFVRMNGRRLLAVTLDLESGGAPGSPSDRLRRMEALAIREAVQATLAAGGVDGVLIAGDLNLVGTDAPLAVLREELDVDGRWLWAALPLRLDGVSSATWENSREPFAPGRLDYVLFGNSSMGPVSSFVFRAADLSPHWRTRHGLAHDASSVTDHLPVVMDFRWMPGL